MWIEIHISCFIVIVKPVTPLAGVWIEIIELYLSITIVGTVTPLAGVWIEIRETLK